MLSQICLPFRMSALVLMTVIITLYENNYNDDEITVITIMSFSSAVRNLPLVLSVMATGLALLLLFLVFWQTSSFLDTSLMFFLFFFKVSACYSFILPYSSFWVALIIVFLRLALYCIFSSASPPTSAASFSGDWSELRPDLGVAPFIGICGEQREKCVW